MECSKINSCSAPLCPLDLLILRRIWYPDEPICTKKTNTEFDDIRKIQRRIAKRVKNRELYFTYEMLKEISRVYPSLKGVDPDKHKSAKKRWLTAYRKKKEKSKEAWQKLKEQGINPFNVK